MGRPRMRSPGLDRPPRITFGTYDPDDPVVIRATRALVKEYLATMREAERQGQPIQP